MPESSKNLMMIVEQGGYPDFTALYKSLGFEVSLFKSMRKALAMLKKQRPEIIIAEFIFQPDFRDRFCNLETLLAVLELMPEVRLIVFYEKENLPPLNRFLERFPRIETLPLPVDAGAIETQIREPN